MPNLTVSTSFTTTRQIEEQLPEIFKKITITKEAGKQLRRDLNNWFNKEMDSDGDLKKTEVRLQKLEKMEKNLQQLALEEEISMSDFKEHRIRIEANQAQEYD